MAAFLSHSDFLARLNVSQSSYILALDVGTKKTGIAIASLKLNIALPKETVPTKLLLQCYQRLAAEYLIEGIVFGYDPENRNQTLFLLLQEIAKKLPLKIMTLFDERYTTLQAHSLMQQHGVAKQKRYNNDDAVAATIILNNFLHKYRAKG